ncbi:PH domain-containing protein [Marinilongibacter aquaticus]|uniref:PH domain-containing protein n=1 Tax=Marinilongibacter aquaticus TaxID=2975157 RepID=UPI0021BD6EED|nr:PH domain-containing protein [Marinilongibacter aquaticus]UBM58285.1 PH domain-containing protein [Marinilongibacter aquaticus]
MDKHVYKSKIDRELIIFIALVFLFVAFLPLFFGASVREIWPSWGILVLTSLFVAYTFRSTEYTIQGQKLHIKSGFLYNSTVDISTIRQIKETRNPLSAPAASLNRLEIVYGKFGTVLISPKEKRDFMDHLLKINPEIDFRAKP